MRNGEQVLYDVVCPGPFVCIDNRVKQITKRLLLSVTNPFDTSVYSQCLLPMPCRLVVEEPNFHRGHHQA
jgi:hypothetical protein